jgi:hypothetical protein
MYATFAIIGTATAPTISVDIGEAKKIPEILQNTSLQSNLTKEEIKSALALISEKYGLDFSQLYNVIECESGFDNSKIGDDGRSRGVAQFLQTTWNENCNGSYFSAYDQLECLAKMWVK